MQLSNKEQELLWTYQNWLEKNNWNDKCSINFIEQNSILVFQVWDLQEIISETIWLKNDNKEWKFYIKNLGEKFNKSFSLKEILKIEKDFILKSFNENRTSNCA
ncbi:hypothetical protein [Spiroplasma ixodetis]|uniref:hypothetical protein n=1 Tax=Spiroplasma ixodetis TaxID=2141 RepID=UPI002576F597|nr:hypothetical protein [Spiroplasma ixodetis]WJG71353.1 hypothetical protein SIXOD_v1c27730 [Spiroplasma ixodetis Y32]